MVDFKDQNGNICDGKVRAFRTGLGIRKVGYPIHRVFVSPFVRCIETAAEAVKAILAVEDIAVEDVSDDWKSDGVVIDSSKIKVISLSTFSTTTSTNTFGRFHSDISPITC